MAISTRRAIATLRTPHIVVRWNRLHMSLLFLELLLMVGLLLRCLRLGRRERRFCAGEIGFVVLPAAKRECKSDKGTDQCRAENTAYCAAYGRGVVGWA